MQVWAIMVGEQWVCIVSRPKEDPCKWVLTGQQGRATLFGNNEDADRVYAEVRGSWGEAVVLVTFERVFSFVGEPVAKPASKPADPVPEKTPEEQMLDWMTPSDRALHTLLVELVHNVARAAPHPVLDEALARFTAEATREGYMRRTQYPGKKYPARS